MDLSIRPAVPSDAPTLAALGPATFREAFGWAFAEADIAARMALGYAPEKVARDLADPAQAWWLAEAEAPFGFIALKRGEAPACIGSDGAVELSRLYLLQAWHGAGAAQALFDAALSKAAAWGRRLWLLAWDENPRALAFYRRQGFAQVGTDPFALGERAGTHLVLLKELSGVSRQPSVH